MGVGTLEGELFYHASLAPPTNAASCLTRIVLMLWPMLRKTRTVTGARSGWRSSGSCVSGLATPKFRDKIAGSDFPRKNLSQKSRAKV